MANDDFFYDFCDSTKAKLAIYKTYICRYLKILGKAHKQFNNTKPLFIGDLFSGPGKDEKGNSGSPKILLDYIASTYFDGLSLQILFNEKEKKYAESLKTLVKSHEISKKSWIKCNVEDADYDDLVPKIIDAQNGRSKGKYFKRFFFIDPFGYKGTRLQDMLNLLKDGNTEILLFVPATFIYRFKAKDDDYEAIKNFLNDFTQYSKIQNLDNKLFIKHIVETLKGKASEYVDCFIIQDNQQKGHNCLLYFTNNRKGYEQFVETKWAIDSDCGEGFEYVQNTQANFLNLIHQGGIKKMLLDFITETNRTNLEIRSFCYDQSFKPTPHGTTALKELFAENMILITPIDGIKVRQNTFYLSEEKQEKIIVSRKHD